jgi:signal transduction histidine kinase
MFMTARRFLVDAGIVAVLAGLTAAMAGMLLAPADEIAIAQKLGGAATWHTELTRWWTATGIGMGAMLVRSRLPLVALAATGAMTLVHLRSPYFSLVPLDFAAPIALYTVADTTRRWLSYSVLAGSVGCAFLPRLLGYPVFYFGGWRGGSLAPPVVMGLAWLLGDRARTRRAYLEQARQRAQDLERQRDQQAEIAAAAERARIARDLHDAVAHGLSIVVIQAQAAAGAMEKRPVVARAALASIVSTGRESLAEMRRLLGLTRPDGPDLVPLPGLGDLPALVERVRAAGLPAELTVTGDGADLPTGVGLSAYRIAQESLTNTLKHAGPSATVAVDVHCGPEAVELTVTDTGKGSGGPPDERRGMGLRGMRERVAMLGGTLHAGDAPDGGFRVRARLPVRIERA